MPKITKRIHSKSQKRVIIQNPYLKVGEDQQAQDDFEEEYQKFFNNLKQKKATVEENKESIEEKPIEETKVESIEEKTVEENKVEPIEEKPVESVENKPKKTKKKSKIVEENETSK